MPDDSPLTPSLIRRGARETTAAVGRSLRAMDRDRRGVLAAALAMLALLFAPWYEVVATARGADGVHHALRQTLSGWQALSLAGVVCALAAVATVVGLLARTGTVVEGLGVEGRRAARARVDGGLITTAGGLAALATLVSLLVHPAPHITLAGVTGATSVRFGLVLELLVAVAIAGLGRRVAVAGGDAARRRARPGAVPRWARPHRRRPPRDAAHRRGGATPAPADASGTGTGTEMPQFDFIVDRAPRVSRNPVSPRTRTARNRSR